MNDILKENIRERGHLALTISFHAATIAMEYFGKAQQWDKADSSPVTEADIAIDKYLQEQIKLTFPQDGILSEETESCDSRFESDFTWIIDPIDGTKEFIRQSPEFCVMIGLCYKGEAVFGVIHIPVTGEVFYGGEEFGITLKKSSTNCELPKERVKGSAVLISRSHRADLVMPFVKANNLHGIPCGSSGVKACRLIDDTAQTYIHATIIHEWDTAAADALVRAAGGYFTDLNGDKIIYNKHKPIVDGIIASFFKEDVSSIREFFLQLR
jgi:3'(2'),5'-bisphosphate nucleotidase